MVRTRGRAPRGERLRASVPHGHWKTTTFVAGLRNTGMVAPMVLVTCPRRSGPSVMCKRGDEARLPARAVNVLGRPEAWSFGLTLWSTLMTTRRVVGIVGSRF